MYKGSFITPKSARSRRAVTMSTELAKRLKEHKIACPPSKDDLAFCTEVETLVEAGNLILREFLPALRCEGLRKIRFHDLRHTFTSLLVATGENPTYIQQQLGHASIQTTLDRYGYLMPGSHREAGERLDEFIFGEAFTQRKAEVIAATAGDEKCAFAKKCEPSTQPTCCYRSSVSKMLAKRRRYFQFKTRTQKCKSSKLVKV